MNDKTEVKTLIYFKNEQIGSLVEFSLLSKFTFGVVKASSNETFTQTLAKEKPNLMIIDLRLGKEEITNISNKITELKYSFPIIFIEAIEEEKGASLTKGFTNEHVTISKYDLLTKLDEFVEKYFTKLGVEEQPSFMKVEIGLLSKLAYLDDEVFIKLSTGRHLKLFSAKDTVTEEDVERYKGKGVDYLYLKKHTINWLIKDFAQRMPEIVDALEKNEEVIVDSTTRDAPEVDEQEDTLNFDQELVEEVQMAVRSTLKQVKRNPKINKMLSKLNVNRSSDGYFNNHIALLCNISCAIAKELGWGTDQTYEKLVFSSYLHDFTLLDHPHLARISSLAEFEEIKDKIPEKEHDIFLNHPLEMLELIDTLKDAPIDSGIIIKQHHERPDKSGFPLAIDGARINLISAVFIVAHDFVDYIIKTPSWTLANYITEHKDTFVTSNFKKVFRTLEKIVTTKD